MAVRHRCRTRHGDVIAPDDRKHWRYRTTPAIPPPRTARPHPFARRPCPGHAPFLLPPPLPALPRQRTGPPVAQDRPPPGLLAAPVVRAPVPRPPLPTPPPPPPP